MLNSKFDEITEKRDDLKIQVESCENKIDQILKLLEQKFKNNDNENIKNDKKDNNDSKANTDRPSVKQNTNLQFVVPERVLSPTNIKALTEAEDRSKTNKVLNEKSRTPHYPKSNVTRTKVLDDKVLWSVQWPDYQPIEYTSKTVLNNPHADNNLLA